MKCSPLWRRHSCALLTNAASLNRSTHNSSSSADASDSRASIGCHWAFPFSRFCCVSHCLQRSIFCRSILFVAIFGVDFFFIGDFVDFRTLFRVRTIFVNAAPPLSHRDNHNITKTYKYGIWARFVNRIFPFTISVNGICCLCCLCMPQTKRFVNGWQLSLQSLSTARHGDTHTRWQ